MGGWNESDLNQCPVSKYARIVDLIAEEAKKREQHSEHG